MRRYLFGKKVFLLIGLFSFSFFIFIANKLYKECFREKIKAKKAMVFTLEYLKKGGSSYLKRYKFTQLISFSNDNYLLENEKEKLVVRIPSKTTNLFVDRRDEYNNNMLSKNAGLSPLEILYFDKNSGNQVTKYLKNAIFLPLDNFKKNDVIQRVALLLKKVHESSLNFENTYDPFEQLQKLFDYYKSKKERIIEPLEDAYRNILRVRDVFYNSYFDKKPCHNDAIFCNFALINNSFTLIDWEYSGNCDPAWDLTCFSSILALSDEKENFLVNTYDFNASKLNKAKIAFFKPLFYLKACLWAALQIEENSVKLTKEEWNLLLSENFKKYKQSIESENFKSALIFLEDENIKNKVHQ
jgi:thiamine kinase-like enzyme